MPSNESRSSQLLRGALDFCLLSLLEAEPRYGYGLLQLLQLHGLSISAGSIYPALGRLRREGLVIVEQRAGDGGPSRSYYSTTPDGSRALAEMRSDWVRLQTAVESLTGTAPRSVRPEEPACKTC